ncbi:MAG: phosphoribosylformylglycinamidine synthase subunit PurQ, partial [Candidatus Delongbacteria bacterium]
TDGINCNIETGRAFELAGALNSEVHLNTLLNRTVSVDEFDIISFPGGFSYGDDVKSGKIFSLKLLKLKDELQKFLDSGRLMIGICNGFQVLTTLGIIPYDTQGEPKISIYWNDSSRFECRLVDLKVPKNVVSPWLSGMNGDTIRAQAAHSEGKITACSKQDIDDLLTKDLVAFQYADSSGKATEEYPFNPNGSPAGIAGLVNSSGNVLGMMPHPERNCEAFHATDSNRRENTAYEGEGLKIFKNAVEYFGSGS